MAEQKATKQEAEPKKGKKKGGGKRSKLFALLALVALLGGGGFFGLKMAGGKKPEAPELKLGDDGHIVSLGEFMVNTKDGASFLKATVLVHCAQGESLFHAAGGHDGGAPGAETIAPFVDVVRKVLANQTLSDLKSATGADRVKAKIAEEVNALYHKTHAKEPKAGPEPVLKPTTNTETWQSKEGPVLVVYFTEYVWE